MCVMLPHCSFNLYIPSNMMLSVFSVFISYMYITFSEVSVYIFCLFFNWVVSYWDTSPLLDIWFANTFSQSVACVFILNSVFQRAVAFYFDTFGVVFLKYLPKPESQQFSPIFASRSFIMVCSTFKCRVCFFFFKVDFHSIHFCF